MYPIQDSNVPDAQAGYMPYFYKSGVFVRYLTPAVNAPQQRREFGESTYNFSSDYPLFNPASRTQTVEQVIAQGYFAIPYANPITALISDKAHTARLGLDDVIHQVRQRYDIYQRNIYEINQSICEVHNALFRQLADHGTLVANQRQQYSVTKQVQMLYELQREERGNLWRDVSRLKLALPENAQQYLTAYRKESLLKDTGCDSP